MSTNNRSLDVLQLANTSFHYLCHLRKVIEPKHYGELRSDDLSNEDEMKEKCGYISKTSMDCAIYFSTIMPSSSSIAILVSFEMS